MIFSDIFLREDATGMRLIIYKQDENQQFVEFSQTETQFFNANPNFFRHIALEYKFDALVRLKIDVVAINDAIQEQIVYKIGEAHLDLPVLLANRGELSLPLNNTRGRLEVSLDAPDIYRQAVKLRFTASHLHVTANTIAVKPYFVFLLNISNRTILLHRSEMLSTKDPEWAAFSVPLFLLQFYQQGVLQLSVYNHYPNHQDELIGSCCTNWTKLQRGPGALNSYMLMNEEGKKKEEKISTDLVEFEIHETAGFFEIVKAGLSVDLGVSIDFTASNGDPTQPTSLHFIHPHKPNPYTNAILKILPPLFGHSKETRISAMGFGARVGRDHQMSNCFPLEQTSQQFYVQGFNGLLNAYSSARLEVMFFGPTEFADSIYHVSKFAKASARLKLGLYYVLVILTDGDLENTKGTRDALVDASEAPMSVVVVGLRDGQKFDKVVALESPILKHSDGRTMRRQVLSFTKFNDLATDDAFALIPFRIQQWNMLYTKNS
ncbi:unnamed protein product, partial [Mesorhabditis spiculigera]